MCLHPSGRPFLTSSPAATGDLVICDEGSARVYGFGVDVLRTTESRYGLRVMVNHDWTTRMAIELVVGLL